MKNDIVIKIPNEIREKIKKDFDHAQLTLRIERLEDDKDWERYSIFFLEEQTKGNIILHIYSEAMDLSREVEEAGGGPIEEFIIYTLIEQIRKHEKEQETRDFFMEISD